MPSTGEIGWALGVLCLFAGIGVYLDIRYRKLPNWLCLAAAVAGLAVAATVGSTAWPWSGPLHSLIALIVGMVLFGIGAIGGGDAKFYASLAVWFPVNDAARLLALTAGFGLVLLMAWTFWRRRAGRRAVRGTSGSAFDKLPYGVAIASGAVLLGGWRL